MNKKYDLIIVGMGPSGVFCAYELIQKNKHKIFKNVATSGLATTMRDYIDGKMSEKDYNLLLNWHFATCERADQLGYSSHLLYICKKL